MKKSLFSQLFGREPESQEARIKKLQEEIAALEKKSSVRKEAKQLAVAKDFFPGRRVYIKTTSMYANQANGTVGVVMSKPKIDNDHHIHNGVHWVQVSFPALGNRKNNYPITDLVFEDVSDFTDETFNKLYDIIKTN